MTSARPMQRRRGPNRKPTKIPISLRVDPDILDAYRATGPGWMSRMEVAIARAARRLVKTPDSIPGTFPRPKKRAKR